MLLSGIDSVSQSFLCLYVFFITYFLKGYELLCLTINTLMRSQLQLTNVGPQLHSQTHTYLACARTVGVEAAEHREKLTRNQENNPTHRAKRTLLKNWEHCHLEGSLCFHRRVLRKWLNQCLVYYTAVVKIIRTPGTFERFWWLFLNWLSK